MLLLAAAAQAAPKIAFPIPAGLVQPESLAQGEQTYSMKIANSGDAPLNIQALRPSCSCTKVVPEPPLTLQPGQTNDFAVTVDLGAELKRGPKNFSLRVESDDPANPVASWHVTVPIIPCVELVPRNIYFKDGSAPTQEVAVIYHSGVPELPVKARFLPDLFGAKEDKSKDAENFLKCELLETDSPLTNRLVVTARKARVLSRYGTVRISVDAGFKFNVLQIDTEKFPKDAE